MLLFEYPIILAEELQSPIKNNITKIVLCLLLKIIMIILNYIFINHNNPPIQLFYILIGLLISIQFGVCLTYKLNYFGIRTLKKSQLQDKRQNQQKQQQDIKIRKIIFNIGWHIIMITNLVICVLSVYSALEPLLSSSIYKLRGPLYFITFQCLICMIYFIKYPFLSASSYQVTKGPSFSSYMYIFKSYERVQLQFTKYLLFSFTIGTILDYICFGLSNIGNFSVNSSSFNLNIFLFYTSLIVLAVILITYWVKTINIVGKFKDILDTQ